MWNIINYFDLFWEERGIFYVLECIGKGYLLSCFIGCRIEIVIYGLCIFY